MIKESLELFRLIGVTKKINKKVEQSERLSETFIRRLILLVYGTQIPRARRLEVVEMLSVLIDLKEIGIKREMIEAMVTKSNGKKN